MSGRRCLIALLGLLAAQARGQHIQFENCHNFESGAAGIPPVVRSYFEKSHDTYFSVCDGGLGVSSGSAISVRDNTCVFVARSPRVLAWGTDRAEILTSADPSVDMMAEHAGKCPARSSAAYATTDGVSTSTYTSIMAKWRSSISSAERLDDAYASLAEGVSKPGLQALRHLVISGRSNELHPYWVHRSLHLGALNHYELHVEDPDHKGQVFVCVIAEWLGQIYTVSQFYTAVI